MLNQPVIFAMDGATDLAYGIEAWIAQHWIPDFRLTPKEEWRRHDREAYALAQETVRGKHAFIINSFASDDMRGVFIPFDGKPIHVKLKESSGPFKGIPVNTRGYAHWLSNNLDSTCVVEFITGDTVNVNKSINQYLQILGETVDEKIWGTVLFASSLVDASVEEITLVGALPYMRQDEKFLPRMLLGPATFAKQMKTAGVDRIITIDVHSKNGMQNACSGAGIRFDHLEARCLLAAEAIKGIPRNSRVLVLAPDIGSSKRSAPQFQETVAQLLSREWGHEVEVGFAIARKVRSGDTMSKITNIIEDPHFPIEKGTYVLCQDDILATGGTLAESEAAVIERGGLFHAACYTHGLFTGDAVNNLKKINRLIGTNTIDSWRVRDTEIENKITTVDLSSVFGQAIKETFLKGSINALLTGLEPR